MYQLGGDIQLRSFEEFFVRYFASFIFVVFSICLLPVPSQADSPGGMSIDVTFTGLNAIWDVESEDNTGYVENCYVEPGLGNVCSEVITQAQVYVDSKGRLTGTGQMEFTMTVDGEEALKGDVAGPLKGKLKNKLGIVYFDTKFKGKGLAESPNGLFGDAKLPISTSFKTAGMVDQAGDVSSTSPGKVCVKTVGCERFVAVSEVKTLSDGSWILHMDIVEDDRGRLSGTGLAQTVLEEIPFSIKGKYNAKKDIASLKLKPDDAHKGSQIGIRELRVVPGDGFYGQATKYKVMGYTEKDGSFFVPWVIP